MTASDALEEIINFNISVNIHRLFLYFYFAFSPGNKNVAIMFVVAFVGNLQVQTLNIGHVTDKLIYPLAVLTCFCQTATVIFPFFLF